MPWKIDYFPELGPEPWNGIVLIFWFCFDMYYYFKVFLNELNWDNWSVILNHLLGFFHDSKHLWWLPYVFYKNINILFKAKSENVLLDINLNWNVMSLSCQLVPIYPPLSVTCSTVCTLGTKYCTSTLSISI